ncbi:hypothetical protein TTHERM_000274704 (macronuclear) [Tetrahymena thermophila SB210]|uniref:Transmembrane protein n=1 Tax=Tetrahymena thermophila (strain SB210) TaxID=312017 RepID=W7XJX4_TETTS|nr:hypothetical protein TTHERM_000274704 [Tetrahymena thermophila SB210]EWS74409.1 hypothetical protein TTHERM_000274704 [Tetrahymena thermophila SB210]|eukprot:XP_012653086.1 hypothetical protein TTHERM_000274704 [Tetrahymena thermophila SB210]
MIVKILVLIQIILISRIAQCVQVIQMHTQITKDYHLNQRIDLSKEYKKGEEIQYEIKISLVGEYSDYELIIYADDDIIESKFTMQTQIQFPINKDICNQNLYQRNRICIDQMYQYGYQYYLLYQLTIKCLSDICRTRQYFIVQKKRQQSEEKLQPYKMILQKFLFKEQLEKRFYLINQNANLDKIIVLVDEDHPCYNNVQFNFQYQLVEIKCQEEVELVFVSSDLYDLLFLGQQMKNFELQPQIKYNFRQFNHEIFFIRGSCSLRTDQQEVELVSDIAYLVLGIEIFIGEVYIYCNQTTIFLVSDYYNDLFFRTIYIQEPKKGEQYQINYIQQENYYSRDYQYDDCFQFQSKNFYFYVLRSNSTQQIDSKSSTPEELEQEYQIQKISYEINQEICFQNSNQFYQHYFVLNKNKGDIFMHIKRLLKQTTYLIKSKLKYFTPIRMNIESLYFLRVSPCSECALTKICLQTDSEKFKISFISNTKRKFYELDKTNQCQMIFKDVIYDLYIYPEYRKLYSNSRIVYQCYCESSTNIYNTIQINNNEAMEVSVNNYFIRLLYEKQSINSYYNSILKLSPYQGCFKQILAQDNNMFIPVDFIQSQSGDDCQVFLQERYFQEKQNFYQICFLSEIIFDKIQIINKPQIIFKNNFAQISQVIQPFVSFKKSQFNFYSDKILIKTSLSNSIIKINDENILQLHANQILSIDLKQQETIDIIFQLHVQAPVSVTIFFENISYTNDPSNDFDSQFYYLQFYYFWNNQERGFQFKGDFYYQYLYQPISNEKKSNFDLRQLKYSNQLQKLSCNGIKPKGSIGLLIKPFEYQVSQSDETEVYQIKLQNDEQEKSLEIYNVCQQILLNLKLQNLELKSKLFIKYLQPIKIIVILSLRLEEIIILGYGNNFKVYVGTQFRDALSQGNQQYKLGFQILNITLLKIQNLNEQQLKQLFFNNNALLVRNF